MARAEALGFESAWTLEQTLGRMPFMSPLQTMCYAAACTERIRLGCVVFVTPLPPEGLTGCGTSTRTISCHNCRRTSRSFRFRGPSGKAESSMS
jgi:hypothetical protein